MCNATIAKKVRAYRELEHQIATLSTQLENLKDAIKSEMQSRGVNELVGDDWKVTWMPVISNRFDQSGFKQLHPELYESFKVASESRRFIVK